MDDFWDFLAVFLTVLVLTVGIVGFFTVILDEEGPCNRFGEEFNVTTVYENGSCFVEEGNKRTILEQYRYDRLRGVEPTPSTVPSN